MANETGRADYSPLAMRAMAKVLDRNARQQKRPEDRAAKQEMLEQIRARLAQDKAQQQP